MFNKDWLTRLSLAIVAFSLMFIGTDGFTSIVAGGGAAGCEADGSFVVVESEASCDSERVLTGTANQVIVTDNGADTTVVLSLPQSIATTSDVTFDEVLISNRLNFESTSEFCEVDAPATIECSTRDNFIFMLDSNVNSTSDLCIRTHGVGSDVWCVDEAGAITLATIDGDVNTVIDLGWGDLDFVDSPADEECVTIEGADDFEAQPCAGGDTLSPALPIIDGATAADTIYIGVPGASFQSSAATFVVGSDIYYSPFQVERAIDVNQLSVEITGAGVAGNTCRIGVYEDDDGDFQPDALIDDAGTVASDSTGWKNVAVTFTLQPGFYLSALICDSAPSLRLHTPHSYLTGPIDGTTTSTARFMHIIRDSAPTGTPHASGFADPGDSPWETVTLGNNGGIGHWVMMRWSLN